MSAATELNNVPDVPIESTRRKRAWLTAFRTPTGIAGLVLMLLVLVLALMSLFGLTPADPAHQNVADSLKPPVRPIGSGPTSSAATSSRASRPDWRTRCG